MRKLNGRELKALVIFLAVIPTGLLATLKLTDVLEGPATIAETITLDAAKWEFIKVKWNGGCGIYTLNVTTLSREGV